MAAEAAADAAQVCDDASAAEAAADGAPVYDDGDGAAAEEPEP